MKSFFAPKKYYFLLFALLIFNFITTAQVGIGTTTPQATLDITGQPTVITELDGVIPPRITGDQLKAKTYTATQTAAIVYVTAATAVPAGQTIDVTQIGYYYFDGTKWVIIVPQSEDWTTIGNSGTTAGTNFLGTIDDIDLVFKRQNLEAGRLGESNTSFGLNTLITLSSGTKNTAIGQDALKLNTTGFENTAIGGLALDKNTTANYNTAVGYQALNSNTDQHDNTAVGAYALSSNTGGFDNAAFGRSALQKNTTGLGNVAMGEHALFENLGGSSNTAVGENALEQNTSGIGNVVIGEDAGTRNTTGDGNVVIGQEALFSSPIGISTGDNNVIIGRYANQANTSGHSNVIIGKDGAISNTTGRYNVVIGTDAMESNTTGNFNVVIGRGAGSDLSSIAAAVAITTGQQNTLIGYRTEVSSSSAENATAIGFRALANCDDCLILGGVSGVNSGTSVNVGIGNNNPSYALDVTGDIRFSGSMRRGGTVLHPDYVFETYFDNNNSFNKAYSFMSLSEVDTFLKNNYHLPGVQSRDDVLENGWIVSENVRVNLEKIEELYLHLIEMNKKVKKLSEDKEILQSLVEDQKKQLEIQSKKIDLILQKLNNK